MSISLTDRIEEWRSQLLDTSKRNRLISLSLGRAGAVKLVHPGAEVLWTRLVGDGGSMTFPTRQSLLGGPADDLADDEPGAFPSLFDPQSEPKQTGEKVTIEACLASPRLRADHLLTELTDKLLKSRLGRLALNAKTSLTEQGVPTLYITFGLLK